jgi:dimeric dUTPase (all-alpha-NTP-PPase superfamily)
LLLNELYSIQAGLKTRIGYNEPDKFGKMMLAMVIEFAEAANDWQGFKYWKKHNEPKISLLEEFVDGLHFILEAGLDLVGMGVIESLPEKVKPVVKMMDLTKSDMFKQVIWLAIELEGAVIRKELVKDKYLMLFRDYLLLGKMLGFKEDQIVNAYKAKNQVNHARQDNGY